MTRLVLIVAVLLGLASGARAQCTSGLIVNCPLAVNPQITDQLLLWQDAQNPHTRKIPLGQISTSGLPGLFSTLAATGDLSVAGTINPGANTVIGSGSALATNATVGFLQVPTMAGTPTGTVGAAGKAAIVFDTTNKKLCYSLGGGTWKCSAAFTP